MKQCKGKCREIKPFNAFSKKATNKDGYQTVCKACIKIYQDEYNKKYYEKNTEKVRSSVDAYRKINMDKVKISQANYNKKKYPANRAKALKKLYNLTPEEYDQKLAAQNGCCAICKRHHSSFKRRLCVDHNHATKKNRGLLCNPCNHLLGQAKENLDTLQNAISYLITYR